MSLSYEWRGEKGHKYQAILPIIYWLCRRCPTCETYLWLNLDFGRGLLCIINGQRIIVKFYDMERDGNWFHGWVSHKWHPIPYIMNYFWPELIGPWSKLVHYMALYGNREPFGTLSVEDRAIPHQAGLKQWLTTGQRRQTAVFGAATRYVLHIDWTWRLAFQLFIL